MNKYNFAITFTSGNMFFGNFDDQMWNRIPQGERILQIDYKLFNKRVVVKNYRVYNHIVQRSLSLTGEQSIKSVQLLCGKEQSLKVFVWDFKTREFYIQDCAVGNEFNKFTGWKMGIENLSPNFVVY